MFEIKIKKDLMSIGIIEKEIEELSVNAEKLQEKAVKKGAVAFGLNRKNPTNKYK